MKIRKRTRMRTRLRIKMLSAKGCAVILCLFLGSVWHANAFSEEQKKTYPVIGIMSNDRSDHIKIEIKMAVSMDWESVVNKDGTVCKKLHEQITLDELKAIVVFEESNLTEMTDDKKSQYDQSSVYFKSCNYVGYYYPPFPWWERGENVLLNWQGTDAYIDTDHSLLLIDYLDKKDSGKDSEKRYVRALFISKKRQFYANKRSEVPVWHDLLRGIIAID
jgi:hypothetical protein